MAGPASTKVSSSAASWHSGQGSSLPGDSVMRALSISQSAFFRDEQDLDRTTPVPGAAGLPPLKLSATMAAERPQAKEQEETAAASRIQAVWRHRSPRDRGPLGAEQTRPLDDNEEMLREVKGRAEAAERALRIARDRLVKAEAEAPESLVALSRDATRGGDEDAARRREAELLQADLRSMRESAGRAERAAQEAWERAERAELAMQERKKQRTEEDFRWAQERIEKLDRQALEARERLERLNEEERRILASEYMVLRYSLMTLWNCGGTEIWVRLRRTPCNSRAEIYPLSSNAGAFNSTKENCNLFSSRDKFHPLSYTVSDEVLPKSSCPRERQVTRQLRQGTQ